MKTCSCNIITRNSENTIKQCLDSVINAGCFSEIVIAIDSRSNDKTANILQGYQSPIPIKVFWYHWGIDGFAGARNATLKASTGNYIFWIDSDETLDPSISILIQEHDGKAYYIHQISRLPDGMSIDVPQVRLFPNIQGVKWELPIHEQVSFSLDKKNIPILDSQHKVYHIGYDSEEKIRYRHIRNFSYLQNYMQTQKRDIKMAYIAERYNESYSYLRKRGLLADSGTASLVSTILSIAIPLIASGVSAKIATNQAKEQANIIRSLTVQEINDIAVGLHNQFPQVSVEDFIMSIKYGSYDGSNNDPDINPDTQNKNYWTYLAIFLVALEITK